MAAPPSIPRSQICLEVPGWRHFYWPVMLARSGTRQNPQTPRRKRKAEKRQGCCQWLASAETQAEPGQAPRRSLPGRGSSHSATVPSKLQAPSVPEEAARVSQSPGPLPCALQQLSPQNRSRVLPSPGRRVNLRPGENCTVNVILSMQLPRSRTGPR